MNNELNYQAMLEIAVAEAKLGYEFAKDYRNQNDALLAAMRGKGTA